jgi:hypothetical protein
MEIQNVNKLGSKFCVELTGGKVQCGKNLFYVAHRIRQRFGMEINALQLKKMFDTTK